MKVSITQNEQKAGLLGGKREWHTTLTVQASEEELAIVSSCNLASFPAIDIPIGGADDATYTIEQMLGGPLRAISTNKWHANDIARRMKGAVYSLKELLDQTTADETGEFEL